MKEFRISAKSHRTRYATECDTLTSMISSNVPWSTNPSPETTKYNVVPAEAVSVIVRSENLNADVPNRQESEPQSSPMNRDKTALNSWSVMRARRTWSSVTEYVYQRPRAFPSKLHSALSKPGKAPLLLPLTSNGNVMPTAPSQTWFSGAGNAWCVLNVVSGGSPSAH